MTVGTVICIALILVAAALVAASVRIAPDDGRIVVVRLGHPCAVLEPGICFILPLLDRIHRVSLDRTVPNWRELSESELQERLLNLARSGELGSAI